MLICSIGSVVKSVPIVLNDSYQPIYLAFDKRQQPHEHPGSGTGHSQHGGSGSGDPIPNAADDTPGAVPEVPTGSDDTVSGDGGIPPDPEPSGLPGIPTQPGSGTGVDMPVQPGSGIGGDSCQATTEQIEASKAAHQGKVDLVTADGTCLLPGGEMGECGQKPWTIEVDDEKTDELKCGVALNYVSENGPLESMSMGADPIMPESSPTGMLGNSSSDVYDSMEGSGAAKWFVTGQQDKAEFSIHPLNSTSSSLQEIKKNCLSADLQIVECEPTTKFKYVNGAADASARGLSNDGMQPISDAELSNFTLPDARGANNANLGPITGEGGEGDEDAGAEQDGAENAEVGGAGGVGGARQVPEVTEDRPPGASDGRGQPGQPADDAAGHEAGDHQHTH